MYEQWTKGIWNKAVKAYFKLLSQDVPGGTKEKHKTDSSVRIAGIQIELEGSASRM